MIDPTRPRDELLLDLVTLARPVPDRVRELSTYPWDSEEIVTLTESAVVSVLDRFLAGGLDAADIEAWANAIEGRDDIGFSPAGEEILRDAIADLANPALRSAADLERARHWRQRLEMVE